MVFKLPSERSEDLKSKTNIRIAIVGAGIGGCACAYFLEDLFANEKVSCGRKRIEIDLYEKSEHVGGRIHKFALDHHQYELNVPTRILSSDVYMNYFLNKNKTTNTLWSSNDLVVPNKFINGKRIDQALIGPKANNPVKFGTFFHLLKLVRHIMSFAFNRFNIYKLQDNGFFFSSIEGFLRKLNPEFFTYSRLDLKDIVFNKCHDQNLANSLEQLVNFASSPNSDDNLPGIVGLNSLISHSDSSIMVTNNRKLCETILNSCECVRVILNAQVKLVAINDKQKDINNKLKYELNNELFEEDYDYIVIAFPLIKEAIRDESFYLDILNKNYLNFEMSFLNSYIINGRESSLMRTPNHVNLVTICLDKCQVTVEIMQKNEATKKMKSRHHSLFFWLNGLISGKEKALDYLFEPEYKIIDRIEMGRKPIFANKTRRAILGFPQIIIDDAKRSRIYHLNSFEWIFGSTYKECNCIAARNISFLIGHRERANGSKSTGATTSTKLAFSLGRFYRPNFLSIRLRTLAIGLRFLMSYLFSN